MQQNYVKMRKNRKCTKMHVLVEKLQKSCNNEKTALEALVGPLLGPEMGKNGNIRGD